MAKLANVLLVDDQENLLSGLRRKLGRQYRIATATSGAEALEKLKSNGPFSVVVSDMRMPSMDGVSLLQEIEQADPLCVRMMLTGNADQDTAVNAINTGHIYRFFSKPCDTEVLKKGIDDGVELHRLQSAEKELIETTLAGSVKLLSEVASITNPAEVRRGSVVKSWARKIGREMGCKRLWELDLAVMLCRIGLIGVPVSILDSANRGDPLPPDERDLLASQPQIGFDLISNIPRLENVARGILYQDKSYDGSGYPKEEVSGSDIPLISRILKLANAIYDETGGDEPTKEVVESLRGETGQFDPKVVDAMTAVFVAPEEAAATPKMTKVADEAKIINLRPGMLLGDDLVDPDGRLILSKDSQLTELQIQRIRGMHKMARFAEPIHVYRWLEE